MVTQNSSGHVGTSALAAQTHSTIASTSPAFTFTPTVASTFCTVPFLGDLISFCIFMASTIMTPCPSLTSLFAGTSTRTTLPGIGAIRFLRPLAYRAPSLGLCNDPGSRSQKLKPEATSSQPFQPSGTLPIQSFIRRNPNAIRRCPVVRYGRYRIQHGKQCRSDGGHFRAVTVAQIRLHFVRQQPIQISCVQLARLKIGIA